MANVQSPDKLIPQSGNVYSQGPNSGVVVTGFAGEGLFGSVIAGAVETSNVDNRDRADDHDRGAAQLYRQLQGLPDRLRPAGRPVNLKR